MVTEKGVALVASGWSYRPARSLLALCAAAVSVVVVTPGASQADPQPTLNEVRDRVARLDRNAEVASEQYNQAVDRVHNLEKRVEAFQATVQRQQTQVTALHQDMGAFAAAQYRAGSVDPTMQLMLSSDPERFLQEMTALDEISTRQAEALAKFHTERIQLVQDRLAASQQLEELERTQATLAAEKREVENNLRQAQQLLNGLSAELRRHLDAEEQASREKDRAQAGEGDLVKLPPYSGPASGRAKVAIAYVGAQLGDIYRWGASGPDAFDCSGLTMAAWHRAGVSLPHNAAAQYASGRKVARGALQPGDLVFFYSPISHVGFYIGGGRMIHAPNSHSHVKTASIDQMPYVGAIRP